MRHSTARDVLAGFLAAATGAAALLLLRERRAAARSERLGGAALETLLDAVDANDPVTGAHVRRVARYALVLAEALGLDERERHRVELVALFHDIGKIHEALFDVIHDDAKLTPNERREIRTHPERGARVLAPLASFYPALPEGVIAHHERWDGKGYPRGLKGESIPLTARIVAIADTFDAVTHARRYRPGRAPGTGAQVIAEGRGAQFDPALVDLFLLPPVFARIREEKDAAAHVERGRALRAKRGDVVEAPEVSFRWRETTPSQTANRLAGAPRY
jgi:putative two-component system response regulator